MKRTTATRRRRDRRARAIANRRGPRFAPWTDFLEERTLLSVSIVDVSVLEGNGGPVQVAGTFATSSQTDYYQFQATAGRTFLFDSVRADAPGYWNLYGPDGTNLAGTYLSNDFEGFLPWTGTYVLAASGPGGALAQPDYGFRIFDVSLPDAALGSNFDAVQSGTLAAGQSVSLEYPASAGTQIYFDNLRAGAGATVQLIDPSGENVASTGSNSSNYDPTYSAPVVLRMTGTYQVKITGTGDYKFRILALPGAAADLTLGATAQGSVADYKTEFYKFEGAIGQDLVFDGQGTSDNAYVYLIDPTGNTVGLSSFDARADSAPFRLTKAGAYLLGVQGRKAGASDYKFRLIDLGASPAATYAVGAVQTGALDPTNEIDAYRFDLTAGQRVYVDNLGGSGDNYGGYWNVYGPNGQAIASGYLYAPGGDNGDGEFVAPSTGTVPPDRPRPGGRVGVLLQLQDLGDDRRDDEPDARNAHERRDRRPRPAERLHLHRRGRPEALPRRPGRRGHLRLSLRSHRRDGHRRRPTDRRFVGRHADDGRRLPPGRRRRRLRHRRVLVPAVGPGRERDSLHPRRRPGRDARPDQRD